MILNILGPIIATAIFRFFACLPLPVLQTLGWGVGWLVWILPSRYKRRSAENLAIALPEASTKVLRGSLISAGQLFVEMPYWHMRRDEAKLAKQVQCNGWGEFQAALALGKGLILLGPHSGSFELLGAIYTSRFRATVLTRLPKQQWLHDWIIKTRTRKNLTMAPSNQSGLRTLLKALKRGESVGILPDQVPLMGEGVWTPLFGKPAYTTKLVQRLQSMTGAPIFIVAAQRNGIGKGFTVRHRALKEPLSDDIDLAAAQMNRALEDMIVLMPTQYLWGYNRYRTPRDKPGAGQSKSINTQTTP
jgi:KDO2-lipid IV(A) lauroyltransferase